MGGEKRSISTLWRFFDSPFTWGGIGVLVGSALVSPTWFKFAFVGGGIAIAIGLLRAGIESRSLTFLLLVCFSAGWYWVWRVIPKPVEPLTKKDALELLSQAEDANRSQHDQTTVSPNDSQKPISRAEFLRMLQQSNSSESKFAIIPNERLNEMTKSTVFELLELASIWKQSDAEIDQSAHEVIGWTRLPDGRGGSRSMNEAEMAKVKRETNQRKANNDAKMRTLGKDAVLRSCDLRAEITHNRLLWEFQNRQMDMKQDALFTRLRTSNYGWNDVNQAHEYLGNLQKELETTIPMTR